MPCASCCGSQADERSCFTAPSCRAHGYAATRAGGQLLFKTPALPGAGDGPLAERIAGFLLNGYFFVALILYAALTVLWVWILSFTKLSRTYSFLALAFASRQRWLPRFCRTVAIRLVIGIVLIWCGLFFIAG
jgi:hypothetical protein